MSQHLVTADPVISPEGFDYGMGAGWLPYMVSMLQNVTQQQGVQSQTGLGLMGYLTNLLQDPGSGAIGLAAAAKYGGPQSLLSATGGQGIDMSRPQSYFDVNMQNLSEFSQRLTAQPADATFINPTAATPATSAPSDSFVWSDYLAGGGAPNASLENTPNYDLLKTAGLLGAKAGGKIPLKSYQGGGTVPLRRVDRDVESLLRRRDNPPTSRPLTPEEATRRWGTNIGPTGPTDEQLNAYGGRELIEAARKYKAGGGDVEAFINQIHNIEAMRPMLASGSIRLPEFGSEQPSLESLLPWMIKQLLEQNFATLPYPTLAAPPSSEGWNVTRPGFKDGGSMVVGGGPHYIVDSEGNPVAALSEDGKPEEVTGVGGVEVIPLDPMRNALYESRKAQADMAGAISEAEESLKPIQKIDSNKVPMLTPESAAQTANVMPKEVATLQLGGFQMLPEQWLSKGAVGKVPLPTSGGPSQTRAEQIGPLPTFDANMGINTFEDLEEMLDPGSDTFKKHHARLTGTAIAKQSQVVDAGMIRAMLSGVAPDKIMSSLEFGTLDPTIQAAYTSMLRDRGVTSEVMFNQMRRARPTSFI